MPDAKQLRVDARLKFKSGVVVLDPVATYLKAVGYPNIYLQMMVALFDKGGNALQGVGGGDGKDGGTAYGLNLDSRAGEISWMFKPLSTAARMKWSVQAFGHNGDYSVTVKLYNSSGHEISNARSSFADTIDDFQGVWVPDGILVSVGALAAPGTGMKGGTE